MKSLENRSIAVIGAGLTGQSCVRFLLDQGVHPDVYDTRAEREIPIDVPVLWGSIATSALMDYDLIIVSPGVSLQLPAIQAAREQDIEIIGDIELFCQHTTSRLVAVTGSNGKSTVVSLVHSIFKQAGYSVELVGNIGRPALDALKGSQPDWFILELSSFQLETTDNLNAAIAAILNITEDHLDRHGTMDAYAEAKYRILNGAKTAILNRDDQRLQSCDAAQRLTFGLSACPNEMHYSAEENSIFCGEELIVRMDRCGLKGLHNVLNIQAAALIAIQAGIEIKDIRSAVEQFEGIAHRFESVESSDSRVWINDSKATNVGAAIASIEAARATTQGQLILIAGGDAKGADLQTLESTVQTHVDYLIAMGKDGRELMPMLSKSVFVDSIQQAVDVARKVSGNGDTVLLAPACASLDMFENYQHRGAEFVSAVQGVAA